MNAHHLSGYAEYPQLRTILGNGVCLCRKCHVGFHGEFGHYGFGVREFHDFFGLPNPNEDFDFSGMPPIDDGNLGNAMMCLLRVGIGSGTLEDLRESLSHINREIERRTKEAGKASEPAARPAGFIPPPDGYKRLIEFLPRGTVIGTANPRPEMYDQE